MWFLRTGGAETTDGRDRLLSSLKISAKARAECVLEGVTKPSFSWIAPDAWVLERVETRDTENG